MSEDFDGSDQDELITVVVDSTENLNDHDWAKLREYSCALAEILTYCIVPTPLSGWEKILKAVFGLGIKDNAILSYSNLSVFPNGCLRVLCRLSLDNKDVHVVNIYEAQSKLLRVVATNTALVEGMLEEPEA